MMSFTRRQAVGNYPGHSLEVPSARTKEAKHVKGEEHKPCEWGRAWRAIGNRGVSQKKKPAEVQPGQCVKPNPKSVCFDWVI